MVNRSFRLLALLIGMLCATLPARADFSFVHITDTHVTATDQPDSNADKNAVLLREINALRRKPAFAVLTGDVVEVGTDAEYGIYRKMRDILSIPLYAAPGNHDVRWNPRGKEGYTLGTQQPLYQSWNRENVHFILLDSTVLLQHWGHMHQAMLDWLKADLEKVGPNRPVIIGFHHWIGREAVQVDNEAALRQILFPYNVRLFLIGHGHSDIQWSVNGVPAIMAKGLYQGSYNLIEVGGGQIRVLRRTEESKAPNIEVISVPLLRPATPAWSADVQIENGRGTVLARRGDLPEDARLAYRVNNGPYRPMTAQGEGWTADLEMSTIIPGEHVVTVQATQVDGRAYQLPINLTLTAPGAPRPAWTANVGGAVQSRLVRGADGSLYVSTMGGDLVALDASTGRERWRVRTGGAVFSTPHIDNGTVYFGSADHHVYAVDAATGALKWKTKTGGAVFAGASTAQGVVCIASVDTNVYGLDAATGAVLWTAKGEGMYQSKAATDGERFFVGGWDNFFRAFDVKTGKEVWRNKFGESFYYSPAIGSPTVGGGKVYVTSNDGKLHAMDAATGRIVWEVPGPSLGYSGPLFREGRIYNASLTPTGRVFAFDAETGKQVWETPTGSVIYDSSAAWGGGNIYVGSVDGTFSALRATDGTRVWQYRLGPGHVLASPATDESRVYIASLSGQVTALPLDPGRR